MNRRVWILHSGALGDSVLVWPLLRALARGGAEVSWVTTGELGRLGAAVISEQAGCGGRVVAIDIQQARFDALWRGEVTRIEAGIEEVICFVARAGRREDGVGERWYSAARRMFPGAEVQEGGDQGTSLRQALWRRHRVDRLGEVAGRCAEAHAPVVMHIGAGSESKRWSLTKWRDAAAMLRQDGVGVLLIGGPVERERLSGAEQEAFGRCGGMWCESLQALREVTAGAAVFAGADSGPAHLAAQLGVPTIALFGPTDSKIWRPIGARVMVLESAGMNHRVEEVVAAIRRIRPDPAE